MSRRVVFDTSTLVSSALRVGSVPHQALLGALGTCDVCGSVTMLDELERVLANPKFDPYLDQAARTGFNQLVRRHVHLFVLAAADILAVQPPCRDPKDNQFLAVA